jgi:hypothetical protein
MKRNTLPFRPTSDCFLIYNGKLVAQDHGHYIAFPGGGIDDGETPTQGATREILEEVGANLKHDLVSLGEITWVWNPEWANNEKRKKRYNQFQGERVYFFFGIVNKFTQATSDEGDDWKGPVTMTIDKAISIAENMYKKNNPNQLAYKTFQIACLYFIKALLHQTNTVCDTMNIHHKQLSRTIYKKTKKLSKKRKSKSKKKRKNNK